MGAPKGWTETKSNIDGRVPLNDIRVRCWQNHSSSIHILDPVINFFHGHGQNQVFSKTVFKNDVQNLGSKTHFCFITLVTSPDG